MQGSETRNQHLGVLVSVVVVVHVFLISVQVNAQPGAGLFQRRAGVQRLPGSPREFLAADYSFINADLANLYGVDGVPQDSVLRKHTFTDGRRGGLLGMGAFLTATADSLGLDGTETFAIGGVADNMVPGKLLQVTATKGDGSVTAFDAKCRIDSPIEIEYVRHGGILQYVLRRLAA